MSGARRLSAALADVSTLASVLADEGTDALAQHDDAPVVGCWTDHTCTDGTTVATVTLGTPHVLGAPVYELTIRAVESGRAEQLRRHLGDAYDEQQAGFWDEAPDDFRAHLADGHLYDAYDPWPGGPAWPHRADHERWAAEKRAEWEAEQAAADDCPHLRVPPAPVAGGSDAAPSRPGSRARRATRKRARQARKRGR